MITSFKESEIHNRIVALFSLAKNFVLNKLDKNVHMKHFCVGI